MIARDVWTSDYARNGQALKELAQEQGNKAFLAGENENGLVWVDYSNLDRYLGLLLARQGSGKSVFLMWQAWFFHLVHNCPIVMFDPSGEYSSHKQEIKDAKVIQRLRRIGLSPDGWNGRMVVVKPSFLEADADYSFDFTFDNLKEFGEQNFRNFLAQAVGINPDSHAQRIAVNYISTLNPKSHDDLLQFYRVYQRTIKDMGESQAAAKIGLRIDQSRMLFGSNQFPFENALKQRLFLDVVGSQAGSEEISAKFSFCTFWLSTAVFEWTKHNRINPCFIGREEASYMLGTFEGVHIVDNEISKQRKAGNHVAYVLQNLEQIPDKVRYQMFDSCIVFAPRLPEQQLEILRAAKMLDLEQANVFKTLDNQTRPFEWGVIDAAGEVQKFRPFAPPSSFHKVS